LRQVERALGPEISVAIVAIDNATGEILAHVGSADYFDDRRTGQIDMTTALRQDRRLSRSCTAWPSRTDASGDAD